MRKASCNRLRASLGAVFLLLAAPVSAQAIGGGSDKIYQWNGGAAFDNFGLPVSGAGDVNGDGFADVIVGAFLASPGGLFSAGSAYVYSGLDGSLLYRWDGGAAYDCFGFSVSGAGDVNGDGFSDVIVGSYRASPGGLNAAGSAYLYSGVNGSLLYQWDGGAAGEFFGNSVSGTGDVNGDGFADVIVGVPGASPGGLTNAGSAYLYSGVNGSLLYRWDGGAFSDSFGFSVSGAGDVNGDGFADVIGASPGSQLDAGSASVYSGADGSLLYRWNGRAHFDFFGSSVSDAGDVNDDGFSDVIVGAYRASPGGLDSAGSAYVYSGVDGSLLYQWDGVALGDALGFSVSGAGDVDGDGFDDLIVGAIYADPGGVLAAGSAYLYSGVDGSLLHQWDGVGSLDLFGDSVSNAGDVNGDGLPDVVVGVPGATPGGRYRAGSAYVYDFHPFLMANTPTISASAGGVLDLTLDFPDTAAFQDYITLMSIHGTGPTNYGVDIPLSLDAYLLDSAAGIYPFTMTTNLHGTLDSAGNAAADITFPAGAYNFALGRTFWLAAVSFPSSQLPAYSSVAVAIEFVP